MKIIMLGHRKRQGKDTFAEMLNQRLPNSKVVAFARPMKEIFYNAMGYDFDEGETLKNESTLFREKLQRFGSGPMKEYFGADVWQQVLLNNLPECDYLIITDFRFPEEYIEGALTVKVHRDDNFKDNHISETALADFEFDVTILNTSTLEALNDKTEYIVELLTLNGKEF